MGSMVGSIFGGGLGTTGLRGPFDAILSVFSRSVFVSVLRSGFFSSLGGGGGGGGAGGVRTLVSALGGADTVATRPVVVRIGSRDVSGGGGGGGGFETGSPRASIFGLAFDESGALPPVLGILSVVVRIGSLDLASLDFSGIGSAAWLALSGGWPAKWGARSLTSFA